MGLGRAWAGAGHGVQLEGNPSGTGLLARLLARLLGLLVRLVILARPLAMLLAIARLYKLFTDLSDFLGIASSHSRDFTPDRLDSRSLQMLWEWKNRTRLDEYCFFYYLIPPEDII